jgi:hypothetical protein
MQRHNMINLKLAGPEHMPAPLAGMLIPQQYPAPDALQLPACDALG